MSETQNPTTELSLASMAALAVNLERQLIESGGELTPEIEKQLTIVEAELPAKVDAYDFLMEKFDAEYEMWAARANKLTKLASSFKRAKESLKARIQFAMENAGLEEIAGHSVRFKLQKSPPSMEVFDESKIPKAYFETVVTQVLKKEQLKSDLKDGIPVQGAAITQSRHVRVYPNKAAK